MYRVEEKEDNKIISGVNWDHVNSTVVQSLSRVWLFPTLWTVARQASLSFTISQSLLKLMSIESMILSNHLVLCCPFSSCLQSCPGSGSSNESALASGGQNIGASALVLPMNIQDWFPLGLTGLSPLEESSSTPQFKSINSSVLRLLYGPTLTSVHDYWKNHGFDYTDLCQQSDVSAF